MDGAVTQAGTMSEHVGGSLSGEDVQRFSADPVAFFRANLASVVERIARACLRAGRERASVRLLPITKTVPAPILRLAYEAGIHAFGENKIQEAMAKRDLPLPRATPVN